MTNISNFYSLQFGDVAAQELDDGRREDEAGEDREEAGNA